MGRGLVALDQNQIDRRKLAQQLGQGRLGLIAQFVHQRPAPGRGQQHLLRARHAVAVTIAAGLIDIGIVMGMFYR